MTFLLKTRFGMITQEINMKVLERRSEANYD